MQEVQVQAGAEAFAFGDGPVGALLIHGFTGSPQGLRELGDYLAERGPGRGRPPVARPRHELAGPEPSEGGRVGRRRGRELPGDGGGARAGVPGGPLFRSGARPWILAARYPGQVDGIVTLAGMVETR